MHRDIAHAEEFITRKSPRTNLHSESHLLSPKLDLAQIHPKPRKTKALQETQTKDLSDEPRKQLLLMIVLREF